MTNELLSQVQIAEALGLTLQQLLEKPFGNLTITQIGQTCEKVELGKSIYIFDKSSPLDTAHKLSGSSAAPVVRNNCMKRTSKPELWRKADVKFSISAWTDNSYATAEDVARESEEKLETSEAAQRIVYENLKKKFGA